MQLEEDIEQCCLIPQLHHELHKKVSRERVGKELEGMISGKSARPKAALETLLRLKLAGSVFDIPTSPLLGSIGIQSPTPYEGDPAQLAHLREHAWEETRGCLELLPDLIVIIKSEIVSIAESSLDGQSISSKVDERMLHLAVFCLPFFDLRYLQKKKEKLVAEYMIKEGIKFSNKDTTSILSLVQGFPGVTTLLASSPPPSGSWTPEQRLAAGLFVKQLSDMWVTSLILGTVALIQKNGPTSSEQWKERMSQWYRTIIGMKLDACWKELPLLNGKAIIEALGLSRGPRVGLYTQKEAEWRLMYPGGTMDDCLKFLKAVQKEQEKDEEETMHHIDKKMHL
jgi:tRNA nucleotidyltransferase (CCA-adding enzyme)